MPSPTAIVTSPTSSSGCESLNAGRKTRVTAEHTLNRVRENQRRHRARRKDYIASLEQKLAEAEKQLAEARAELAAVKAERDACVSASKSVESDAARDIRAEDITLQGTNGAAPNQQADLLLPPPPPLEHPDVPDLSFLGPFYIPDPLNLSPTSTSPLSLADLQLQLPDPIDLAPGPPPCCKDSPSAAPPEDPTDPECTSCKTRPAPAPSESTTLCAQAYVLIQQQNFRAIDPATIRLWLYQGFRRAQRQGEGCRVENGALFRLLDYISGV
ncbi:hypothetical protein BU26DRAFT_520551 [Trematosphaeria pertusa]|uniref:BZIP domain-containing protein n=1 Tax=Trematosphaeria pertusa TaxID=390896 RepID=A0A6A6I9X6_9PLEO|nr:uncharacterized protein BU26DRAFT_520551 [Trematosphaeria pertusa]KAF2247374.1 hypothetical protein BU26DRAFT_520551 [Trematosphaeria pertusa]